MDGLVTDVILDLYLCRGAMGHLNAKVAKNLTLCAYGATKTNVISARGVTPNG